MQQGQLCPVRSVKEEIDFSTQHPATYHGSLVNRVQTHHSHVELDTSGLTWNDEHLETWDHTNAVSKEQQSFLLFFVFKRYNIKV